MKIASVGRWKAALVGLCLVATGLLVLKLAWPRPKYNVLLITLDTTRADHVGCYGATQAETPTLDALAHDGVLFERAFVTVPLTLPSHASMLTGLYPPEHGIRQNGRGPLDSRIPHLAELLQQRGYDTSAFLASVVLHARYGLDRGFAVYDDDMAGGERHGDEQHLMRPANQVVDKALAWLGSRDSRPFFCWVHLFDPHAPYDSHPEVFGDRFADRPYDGDIAFADFHVGRLIDFLKQRRLYDQTLIVVAGDHGEGLGEHQEEEHGFMLYDSTLRVPFIISCPNLVSTNQRVATPVSLADVMPTVLDSLKFDVPRALSGVSLAPALRREAISVRPCYAETSVVYDAFGWSPLESVIVDDWKYIQTARPELYNLAEDPTELNDLIATEPDQAETMAVMLQDLRQKMVERTASDTPVNETIRRELASLGYVGGHAPLPTPNSDAALPDVKDMIVYYNAEFAARKLLREGQFDEIVTRMRDVVAEAPTFAPAWMMLASALQKQNRSDEAMEVLQAAATACPKSAAPHFELAKYYNAAGDQEKAVELYKTAMQLDPHDAMTKFNLGSIFFAQGEFPEARTLYEEGLEESPDSTVGHYNFSVMLATQNELIAALAHGRRAVELNPRNPQFRLHVGRILASMGNLNDAVAEFEHAVRIDPHFPGAAQHLQEAKAELLARTSRGRSAGGE